ncbi:MAG TPA: DnaJ C-terminal domain-containing protein [Beijerinckiaceae bacterium]|nr:DnaJ C-terminal domain-containing protein [Beijerinckiaceae bacterium]
MRDPYSVLGVAKTAGEADIKKAFRRLAKTYHPDHNKTDPKAKERFAEVNAAYEILGDAGKRAQFDRGEIGADGKPRFQGFEGFSGADGFGFGFGGARRARSGGDDIFSQIFGEAFRTAERGPRAARRGEDVNATLTVTLEEVAAEARRRVALPTGREVDVVVPKGVVDGQVIRLRGLGQSAGEPGDVLLTLRIAPHERFTAEGANLRTRVPVELDEAVLGGTVRIPTLTGAVEMTIPAMTSSGRTFRLRGKGLPAKEGRGDLLATIEIRLPAEPDPELLAYAKKRRSVKA